MDSSTSPADALIVVAPHLSSPLPVPGMEYWGLEAAVRIAHLSDHAFEGHHVEVDVLFANWTGTISGRLRWYTYPDDLADDDDDASLRGKTRLCVGDRDVHRYRGKAVYLRPLKIAGSADRQAALPGVSAGSASSVASASGSTSSSSASSSAYQAGASSSSSDGTTTMLTVAAAVSLLGS